MSAVRLVISSAKPVAVTWAAANVAKMVLLASSGTISGGAFSGSEPTIGKLAP